MSQPPEFQRGQRFTSYAAQFPAAPFNASGNDTEFDNVKATLDAILTNLQVIQRDDAKLANGSVHADALNATALALFTSGSWTPKGIWATATDYVVGDIVTNNISTIPDYLVLPGTVSNYASTPDSADVSVTGDIDIRMKVALDDWTPAAVNTLMSKWNSTGNQRSWILQIQPTTGYPRLYLSEDGSSSGNAIADAAPSVVDGSPKWIRVTWVNSTDVVTFYESDDGVTWSQLGTTKSIVATGIYDGSADVTIGVQNNSLPLDGKVYYAEVRDGVAGTIVATFNPAAGQVGATTLGSNTGEVWTLTQSGDPAAEFASETVLPGAAQTYLAVSVHTSDDFSEDYAGGKWVPIQSSASNVNLTAINGLSAVEAQSAIEEIYGLVPTYARKHALGEIGL